MNSRDEDSGSTPAVDLVRYALLACFCFAVAATLQLGFDLALRSDSSVRALIPTLPAWRVVLVAVLFGAMMLAVWTCRSIYASAGALRFRAWISRFSDRVWCVTLILAGIALRLLWCAVFAPRQTSDGAAYMELAIKLANGEAYFTAEQLGGYAFWPPGMPLLLAPLVRLFGANVYLPMALNLLLFAIGMLATYALAKRLIGVVAARVTIALLAVWPGFIFAVGLVEKELILLALMPLAMLLHLRSTDAAADGRGDFASGLLFGFCALTQPSSLLVPFLVIGADLLLRTSWRRAMLSLVWLLAGMVLVVAPWTIRNYLVLGEFVPISTNAAMTMYAGNHASALGNAADTGGYVTPPLLLDWRAHNELERARFYRDAAQEWIDDNPLGFAQLTAKRLELILGDDSDGVYRTLRLGLGEQSTVYFLLKLLSNAFWLLVIVAALPALISRRTAQAAPRALALTGVVLLYFVAVHALVEGGARHHMGTLWCYALIVGYAVAVPQRRLPDPVLV